MSTGRNALAALLHDAAELEHALCVQYLFAAFSLKARPDEGGVSAVQIEMIRDWRGALLAIARGEMLHLGLVCNLLSAIGAAPHFGRANFPYDRSLYRLGIPGVLAPFGDEALGRFIAYEAPFARDPVARNGNGSRSVGELYDEIRSLFASSDEARLFAGDPAAQTDYLDIVDPTNAFTDEVRTGYGVEPFRIVDRRTALAAIALIVEQGEGAPSVAEESHHAVLAKIRAELRGEQERCAHAGVAFEPARPVVENPLSAPLDSVPGGTVIAHPSTAEVARLFNDSYQTMLLMLIRFYAHLDETPAERFGLQQIIFFPFMTMVVRPLGEILTELPAFGDGRRGNAGPCFELGRGIELIPHKAGAHAIFAERLADLARSAGSLRYLEAGADPRLRRRLAFVAENMARLADNFTAFTANGAEA
ncbi:MAG TPA: ferritin-like domain-containing protein [Candidatus Elarobacter sp.]|nr:ferritin-like domain-containing protein [Candidatus Elarobacter sp.]